MKLFLSVCCWLFLMCAATGAWLYEFNQFDKRKTKEVAGLRSDLQALQLAVKAIETNEAADRIAFGRDIVNLKTDSAQFFNLRESLDNYMAARKNIGAFRELGKAIDKGFIGLLAKEQELDVRLKKIEGNRCKK